MPLGQFGGHRCVAHAVADDDGHRGAVSASAVVKKELLDM
jgi:hypothetical protein